MTQPLSTIMPPVDAKTLDQILDQVSRTAILKRFDEIRQAANQADAERDRLRKYIQTKIAAGQYEDVILGFKSAGNRSYANSGGLAALRTAVIVIAPTQAEHFVAFGEEVTVRNRAGEICFRGTLADNTELYFESETRNIQITHMPNL